MYFVILKYILGDNKINYKLKNYYLSILNKKNNEKVMEIQPKDKFKFIF